MHRSLLLCLLLTAASPSLAQPDAKSEVLAVLDRFFAAMTARDTVAMGRTLTPVGTLHAVVPGSSKAPRATTHAEYLKHLADGKESLLERYWDPIVRIDEAIATVTTPYDFHVDGQLSHCGTDVFTLVKGPDGWRISGVAYTMQREGCPPSPLGPVRP